MTRKKRLYIAQRSFINHKGSFFMKISDIKKKVRSCNKPHLTIEEIYNIKLLPMNEQFKYLFYKKNLSLKHRSPLQWDNKNKVYRHFIKKNDLLNFIDSNKEYILKKWEKHKNKKKKSKLSNSIGKIHNVSRNTLLNKKNKKEKEKKTISSFSDSSFLDPSYIDDSYQYIIMPLYMLKELMAEIEDFIKPI